LGFVILLIVNQVASKCCKGCDVALASYYVWGGSNLTFLSKVLAAGIPQILSYNPNQNSVQSDTRINVPVLCDCINGEFLAHVFDYNVVSGDNYDEFNSYDPNNVPENGKLNVTVNCSCGDSSVSKNYGLFVTYPLWPRENLTTIAAQSNVSADLLQQFNPGSNFSAGSGLVYIPGKDCIAGQIVMDNDEFDLVDFMIRPLIETSFVTRLSPLLAYNQSGSYPTLTSSSGMSGGAIASITVVGALVLLLLLATVSTPDKAANFTVQEAGASPRFTGIMLILCIFMQKAAIKKMDMQASKEFLAELKVLMHVHHLNLLEVRLCQRVQWAPSGYMPPEVVLYELISAMGAVVKPNGTNITESIGLVALFDDALSKPDLGDDLRKLVDPRLGDSYPIDAARKRFIGLHMAQLAKACTQENPQLRPSMRSIVVALMTLSSSTEDWDVGSFYHIHPLANLMSGR
ncbi:hypothetical protein RJ641_017253, partial [Dillenia turbinata]